VTESAALPPDDLGPTAPGADEVAVADKPKATTTRSVIEWSVVIVGAVIVALVIKTFLFQAFYIPSPSMEPTLRVGDRVLVNKLSYDAHDINRGDIIVFRRPPNADQGPGEVEDLIKRVIALPGETVEVRNGHVFIDGKLLNEPYLPEGTLTPAFETVSGCSPSCTIPKGEVFVLGDNRGNSSASNRFGPISDDLVVGRAFVRVWPLSRLGGI
jgi:signal peptidase I